MPKQEHLNIAIVPNIAGASVRDRAALAVFDACRRLKFFTGHSPF